MLFRSVKKKTQINLTFYYQLKSKTRFFYTTLKHKQVAKFNFQHCFNLILNNKQCVSHAHISLNTQYECIVCIKHKGEHLQPLSVCVAHSLSLPQPDMQEFQHELYIATQQPPSGPGSQTNNGQHDNSIMK